VATVTTPLPPGAIIATIASGSMIAQQVAGKAARDALFLSNFPVTTLPIVMAAGAALSLGAVIYLGRLMTRHSPSRVVPALFALNCVALLSEWVTSFYSARIATVGLYLHTAVLGASVISAFWSLINEQFDPHSAKRAVNVITGGGTLGGVLGGIVAWRVSSLVSITTMLPLLATINLVSLWATVQLPRSESRKAKDDSPSEVDANCADSAAPWKVIQSAPYLRNLSVIVLLGAVTSGLLDYVFSAEVARAVVKSQSLLSFFSLFWLLVSVLTFALQAFLGRVTVEKLGLAATLGLLPGIVILGGAFGLAVPGLVSTTLLRGAEAIQRNSLYRSAYELLYTPLSEKKKRATKTFIDVGMDRIGTVAASAVTVVALHLAEAKAGGILLCIAVACAIVLLARSRPLHNGYVAVLEESLRQESGSITESRDTSRLRGKNEAKVALRDAVATKLEELPETATLAAIAASGVALSRATAPLKPSDLAMRLDAAFATVEELCSKNVERIRGSLRATESLRNPSLAFAILLLADERVYLDAIQSLRVLAGTSSGQLIDALLNLDMPVELRRRIPRVLLVCPTQEVTNGLLRGTEDTHFEVRYECGQALLAITRKVPTLTIELTQVIAIIQREVAVSKEIWESQPAPQFDDETDPPPALVDRLLRDRIDRSLEHIFTILALHIDQDSLRFAFKALHEKDTQLRGTALEYLETVLPDEVRDAVWPYLGEVRPMRAARPAQEILQDLMRLGGPPN